MHNFEKYGLKSGYLPASNYAIIIPIFKPRFQDILEDFSKSYLNLRIFLEVVLEI